MLITDALILDAASVRLTRDGYMVAVANIARTGVQTYLAGELGLADRAADDVVRVWRPDDEVFAADAMASLAHRPMTMDHPPETVTAANWKRYAIGATGGEVARDGDTIRVPLTLMDAAAIADVQAGKRELSVGYACELVIEHGTTPEGEPYDAVQRSIRGNHVAVCTAARGGPRLRIGDAAPATDLVPDLVVHGVTIFGLTDEARAAVEALQGRAAALDSEVAALAARLAAAEPTPERLAALTEARMRLIGDAERVAGCAVATDGCGDPAIRRAAVAARLGDAAESLSDAAVEGAFAALLAAGGGAADAARAVIAGGTCHPGDARQALADAKAARLDRFGSAYRGTAAEAA